VKRGRKGIARVADFSAWKQSRLSTSKQQRRQQQRPSKEEREEEREEERKEEREEASRGEWWRGEEGRRKETHKAYG
jgi:ribosomal protein L12E/L44/L45/RPP1/RPP2